MSRIWIGILSYNIRILGKSSGTNYIRIYSCGDVPGEGNTGGCASKGGQQPVSQVMRQAQQVIYRGRTGQFYY